jgi:hypothetical protein
MGSQEITGGKVPGLEDQRKTIGTGIEMLAGVIHVELVTVGKLYGVCAS